MHLDARWEDAAATLLAGLARRRGARRVIAAVVAEVVIDADGGASVLLQHALATGAAVAPAPVFREIADALQAAASEAEARVQ